MSWIHSTPNMAKALHGGAVPTRAACRVKAMPTLQRSFRAWITSKKQRSNAEQFIVTGLVPVSRPAGARRLARARDRNRSGYGIYSLYRERMCEMANPEDTLTLETTKGKVVIEMRSDLAPGHVARIKELVKDGFYDGIVFHRVIDGFMAQTGCPHGTGTGGSGK